MTSALYAGLILGSGLALTMDHGVIAALIATAVVFVRRDRFLMSHAPAP